MCQSILSYKLSKHKISQNSFYSINQEQNTGLQKWFDETPTKFGKTVYDQIICNNIAVLHASDGPLFLSPAKGVTPGFTSSTSVNIFNQDIFSLPTR